MGIRTRSRFAAPFALGVTALAIAGCGSSNSSSSLKKSVRTTAAPAASTPASSSTPSTTTSAATTAVAGAVPAVAALVPAAVKSKGTLTVAADATYAPDEFIGPDGKTVVGMDPDLVKALAATMGLKVNVVNQTFDSIIPGLASGKYDIGASSFTDTKAREKTVDFVTYFTAGESFYTKASGGTTIAGIGDLCGHTVAVEKGTTEQADATAQGAKCKKAGKSGVNVLVFPDQNGANLAVVSGKAQLGFADSPVAGYQVQKSGGQFKLVGASYASAPYGLALPKGNGLAPAVLAALKALMTSGEYTKILTHWGLQSGAITTPKINGAIS